MPAVQFIDETVAGETLRDHEVWLANPGTMTASELLQLRFGDNVETAWAAFRRGAFRLQVAGTEIDSLDTHVALAPGQPVKLIRVTPPSVS